MRESYPNYRTKFNFKTRSKVYSVFYLQFRVLFDRKHKTKKPVKTGKHKHKSHPAWPPIDRVHKLDVDESALEIQYSMPEPTPEEKALFDKEYQEWLKSIDAEAQIALEFTKTSTMFSLSQLQVLLSA